MYYEDAIETAQTDKAICESEREYAVDGVLIDAREALAALRKKYFE